MTIRIISTYLIWLLVYLPLIAVSLIAVPVMLHFGWDGYSTWFGNRKYGRYGNAEYPTHSRLQEWLFLAVRNPISNFGKEVLAVSVRGPVTLSGNPSVTDGKPGITGRYIATAGWAWEVRMVYRTFPGRCFEGRWGWKLAGKNPGDRCTFVCRANPFKKFD